MNRRYGWIRQLHDQNDFLYTVSSPVPLPATVDHRPNCPPVYDQGDLGSCTANAIAGAFQFDQLRQKITNWVPSRLFIYFNERSMEGTVQSDAGAVIRDGIKSIATLGVCPETEWPYVTPRFPIKPPGLCYKDALKNKATRYASIAYGNTLQMQQALALGNVFVFGFSVYDSFESQATASTGIVTMPARGESLLGGHAVLCVGYTEINGKMYFIVRNSWGSAWGASGYCYFPFEYLHSDLASDIWTVNAVS